MAGSRQDGQSSVPEIDGTCAFRPVGDMECRPDTRRVRAYHFGARTGGEKMVAFDVVPVGMGVRDKERKGFRAMVRQSLVDRCADGKRPTVVRQSAAVEEEGQFVSHQQVEERRLEAVALALPERGCGGVQSVDLEGGINTALAVWSAVNPSGRESHRS